MKISINHGTGPVVGATKRLAIAAVRQLVTDVGLDGVTFRRRSTRCDYEGRYSFKLRRGKYSCVVDVPGLPLVRVRYLDPPQNIWDFPRLYINGSSFVWKYVVTLARLELTGKVE